MFKAVKPRADSERILVVRLSSMGDVIHTLPAVATLKHSFPRSEVTWVISPRWAPLLEGNPFVSRLVLLDRHHLRSVAGAWRELHRTRFDLAIADLASGRWRGPSAFSVSTSRRSASAWLRCSIRLACAPPAHTSSTVISSWRARRARP